MPHDSIDLDLGGLFCAWHVEGHWSIRMHHSASDAIDFAQALIAIRTAKQVYIGTMPAIIVRVDRLFPPENPEGP